MSHIPAADLRDTEWCLPDSPAQRWLEAHGYREVEYRRFHPGEREGWSKMARVDTSDGEP